MDSNCAGPSRMVPRLPDHDPRLSELRNRRATRPTLDLDLRPRCRNRRSHTAGCPSPKTTDRQGFPSDLCHAARRSDRQRSCEREIARQTTRKYKVTRLSAGSRVAYWAASIVVAGCAAATAGECIFCHGLLCGIHRCHWGRIGTWLGCDSPRAIFDSVTTNISGGGKTGCTHATLGPHRSFAGFDVGLQAIADLGRDVDLQVPVDPVCAAVNGMGTYVNIE